MTDCSSRSKTFWILKKTGLCFRFTYNRFVNSQHYCCIWGCCVTPKDKLHCPRLLNFITVYCREWIDIVGLAKGNLFLFGKQYRKSLNSHIQESKLAPGQHFSSKKQNKTQSNWSTRSPTLLTASKYLLLKKSLTKSITKYIKKTNIRSCLR